VLDPERLRRYLDATEHRPPQPLFGTLEPHLPPAGDALDLGCGAGRGTTWLLERGLSVVAVDISEDALARVRRRVPPGAQVRTVCARFEDLDPPPCDVAVAVYSPFFLEPDAHGAFWARLVAAIRRGGVFAGHFLGPRDTWATRGLTVLDRSAVEALLAPFEVLHLLEEDADGTTALGERKHWHTFHVVARRR